MRENYIKFKLSKVQSKFNYYSNQNMEKKILVSDLVQYIQKLGMTLNVERALREPEKAKDQAWSILVFLAKQSLGIPNAKLDYIQPDLIHLIEV